MKTLLLRGEDEPPDELREIVRAGSTELEEVRREDAPLTFRADRVVVWNGRDVAIEDRRLRWPEDKDELRMLFQTGG